MIWANILATIILYFFVSFVRRLASSTAILFSKLLSAKFSRDTSTASLSKSTAFISPSVK